MKQKRAIVIGSGIGGLAIAIRLARLNYHVEVFEKNTYVGGKLCEMQLGKYRFDKGPSLFTMPHLMDELSELCDEKQLEYKKLTTITHYFYADGTQVKASSDKKIFAEELKNKLSENADNVLNYLKRSELFYKVTAPIFLEKSLHKVKNHFSLQTLKGIANAPRLQLLTSMNKANEKAFTQSKTVQLFNRYATYNGSNPYTAPALLNIISHLEFNMGAYFPIGGMHKITEHLFSLAKKNNVTFYFNTEVQRIINDGKNIRGIKTGNDEHKADVVVSDVDIHLLYNKFLDHKFKPTKLLKQEKSSSAFIFYWGIKRSFDNLGLHNILFSADYEAEFNALFNSTKPFKDPTVYINISAKECITDAPTGCENWFVMVNVPHNASSLPVTYQKELRQNVITKINNILKTNIENCIEEEAVLSPFDIETQTSSFGGSLYGNSSNSKFSAFLRHPNYTSKLKNLYFVGGSVHPGGGIPLCLMSAKIVADIIQNK